MAPLALALHLALASAGTPSLAPRLDPGLPGGMEAVLASAGVLGGDVAVLGAGYLTLQLFASGTFAPSAENFRRAAYVLAGTALLVPPLTAVLMARLGGRASGAGSFWRAILLASAGHALALTAGYLAAPHFWVVLPAQLLAVGAGTALGLRWGRGAPSVAPPSLPSPAAPLPTARDAEPRDPGPSAGLFPLPTCPAS